MPQGTVITISDAAGNQDLPAVASPGTGFFVVWYDGRTDASGDIYGTRIDAAGVVLDTKGITIATAANSEQRASVASNGTDYLVVWSDLRAGNLGLDLWGARVKPTGEVIDTAGFPVAQAAGDQDAPSVASNGTDYLVAFRDLRAGSGYYDLYANRVTGAGTVADLAGFAVSTDTNSQDSPKVAFAGTRYLIVWQDRRSGTDYDLYGSLVPSTGPGTPFVVASGAGDQVLPSVAGLGTGFVVAWQDKRTNASGDLYAQSVSSAGALGTELAVVTGGTNGASGLAGIGSEALLAWECYHSGTSTDVCGARLSAAPAILSTFDVSKATRSERYPAIASDGTEYLVAWQDGRSTTGGDTYVARVSAGGTLLDATGLLVNDSATTNSAPAVASQGKGNWLVAYDRFLAGAPTDAYRIRAAIVTDVTVCSSNAECNDGDPCTLDTCNASSTCDHTFSCQPDAAVVPPDASMPPDAATIPPDAAMPPDAATIPPDAATIPPDAAVPPDAATIPPDAAMPPDAATIPPDAATIPPDAATIPPDAATIPPDAATIPPDAATIPPDAATIPPDAATIPPDAATIPPDAATVPPDAATIPPDAASIPPDAAAIPPDAAAVPPDAAEPFDAAVLPIDASVPAGDAAAVQVDAAAPSEDAAVAAADSGAPPLDPTAVIQAGCSCTSAGLPGGDAAWLVAVVLAAGWRPRRR